MSVTRSVALPTVILVSCGSIFLVLHWNELGLSQGIHVVADAAPRFLASSPAELARVATRGAVKRLSAMLVSVSEEELRSKLESEDERDDDKESDAVDLEFAKAEVRAGQLRLGLAEKDLRTAVKRAEGWMQDTVKHRQTRRQQLRATRKVAQALTRLGNFEVEHGRPQAAVLGLQRAVTLTKRVVKELDDEGDDDDTVALSVSRTKALPLDAGSKHTQDTISVTSAEVALANALCAAGGRQGLAEATARSLFGEAFQALSTAEKRHGLSPKLASLSSNAHISLARCLHQGGDLLTASATLGAARSLAASADVEARLRLAPRLARILGGLRHDEGKTEDAQRLYDEFITTMPAPRGSIEGPNEFVELFEVLQDRALTQSSLGQPREALQALEDVRVLQERLNSDLQARSESKVISATSGGPDGALWASMARSYALRAEILLELDDAKSAVKAAERAVPMLRQLLIAGGSSRPLVDACNTLGNALMAHGAAVKAKEAYTEGLELAGKLYGENSPLTAAVIHNLAATMESQGDHAGALRLMREALETLRRTLGEDNPDVAASYASISNVLHSLGRTSEALKSIRLAASTAKRGLPEGHFTRKLIESRALEMEQDMKIASHTQSLENEVETVTRAVEILEEQDSSQLQEV